MTFLCAYLNIFSQNCIHGKPTISCVWILVIFIYVLTLIRVSAQCSLKDAWLYVLSQKCSFFSPVDLPLAHTINIFLLIMPWKKTWLKTLTHVTGAINITDFNQDWLYWNSTIILYDCKLISTNFIWPTLQDSKNCNWWNKWSKMKEGFIFHI